MFPATDERYRGANSISLLTEIAERVAKEGWWIDNVDVAVVAETPKLASHIEAMAANIGGALHRAREPMGRGIGVTIKPKRGEGNPATSDLVPDRPGRGQRAHAASSGQSPV